MPSWTLINNFLMLPASAPFSLLWKEIRGWRVAFVLVHLHGSVIRGTEMGAWNDMGTDEETWHRL